VLEWLKWCCKDDGEAERKSARAQELRLLATAKPSLWKWGKRVSRMQPEAGLKKIGDMGRSNKSKALQAALSRQIMPIPSIPYPPS
jgi:hypothetical protein